MRVGGFQTVGRNEGVDVEAARLRAGDRSDLDMADCSGRNPWKDVLDLVVRQRRMLRSAQDSEYVRSRSPTLLMPDQGEIDFATRAWLHWQLSSPMQVLPPRVAPACPASSGTVAATLREARLHSS